MDENKKNIYSKYVKKESFVKIIYNESDEIDISNKNIKIKFGIVKEFTDIFIICNYENSEDIFMVNLNNIVLLTEAERK